MALIDDVPKLVQYFQNNRGRLDYNNEIFEILEGNLLPRIKAELRNQMISNSAYAVAEKLIPPLNFLARITDKRTQIYSDGPKRVPKDGNEDDQELIDYYTDSGAVNVAFNEMNRFFNSTKMGAIEPFLDRGEPKIRALMPQSVLPYSDNKMNPLEVTHIIKFMGTTTVKRKRKLEEVEFIFIYTDEEFIAVTIEDQPQVLEEFSPEDGEYENPTGVIPVQYGQRSHHSLVPFRDTDTLAMTVLIPTLYTHLNFAVQYQSQSIVYGIDVDIENLDLNPNAIWVLKTNPQLDKRPEIGTVKPEVDISEVNKHIQELLANWLITKNLRPGGVDGKADNSASGVSLMIKEMDTTQDKKEQISYFKEFERDFWERLKEVHNFWVDNGDIEGFKKFSDDFEIAIEFQEPVPVQNKKEAKDIIDFELRWGLTHLKKAIKDLHPELDEAAIETIIDLIEAEKPEPIEAPVVEDGEQEGE